MPLHAVKLGAVRGLRDTSGVDVDDVQGLANTGAGFCLLRFVQGYGNGARANCINQGPLHEPAGRRTLGEEALQNYYRMLGVYTVSIHEQRVRTRQAS